MNKNIRRSIVIAAGVSGAWALGSAVASADEMPAHSVAVPDLAGDVVADVQGTVSHVQGTVDDVTHGTVGSVTGKAQDTVAGVTGQGRTTASGAASTVSGTVSGTAAKAAPQAGTAVTGAQGTVRHADARVEAVAAHAKQQARTYVEGVTTVADTARTVAARAAHAHTAGVPNVSAGAVAQNAGDRAAAAQDGATQEIDYLFGPLSAFAPDVDRTVTGAQGQVQGATAQVQGIAVQAYGTAAQVPGYAQNVPATASGAVGGVTTAAGPVVDETSAAVLPPSPRPPCTAWSRSPDRPSATSARSRAARSAT